MMGTERRAVDITMMSGKSSRDKLKSREEGMQ